MKRTTRLGMNPSTASHRLVKDTLFRLVVEAGHVCHRCGKPLDRATFSIEHIVPWLNSDDPVGLFFEQRNIAFSHLHCNSSAAEKPNKRFNSTREQRTQWDRDNRVYDPLRRRAQYMRTGKYSSYPLQTGRFRWVGRRAVLKTVATER